MDKLIQPIGIVLLFLVGLGGSEDIYGKKRALTFFSVCQQGGLCQMRGRIVGNWKESEVGRIKMLEIRKIVTGFLGQ